MNPIKITRLEPGKVVSFHVKDSLQPEKEVFERFHEWAEANGLPETHRYLPVLGFNNPWGPEGKRRGYEILCFLEGLGDVDLSGVTVKDFPGGLFAVTTIPGLDVIAEYGRQLRRAIDSHPRYAMDYPEHHRCEVDPSPELEMVYTPKAQRPDDFVLDYFIPIKEIAREGPGPD
jgi:DNA gyrase inhibitor GyrI